VPSLALPIRMPRFHPGYAVAVAVGRFESVTYMMSFLSMKIPLGR
jgi:hypothetical protein